MITTKRIPHYRLRKEALKTIEGCGYRASDKNAYWFVAYVDGVYAGIGGLWKLNGPIAYLGPTFVKEDFRGRGCHRELIEVRLKFCCGLSVEEVWSRTDYDNIASARNLIRCGFNLSRPKIVGMLESGNFTVTLDGAEIIEADRNELFFSQNL